MPRRATDPAVLGPAARRQVDATLFAVAEQQRQRQRAAKRQSPEDDLQRAVVKLLAGYEARGLLVFTHVPNGGKRTKVTAAKLKALGTRAGVPDLLVWLAGGRSFGLELKAIGGRVSDTQRDWAAAVGKLGHRVHVCRTVAAVRDALHIEGVA